MGMLACGGVGVSLERLPIGPYPFPRQRKWPRLRSVKSHERHPPLHLRILHLILLLLVPAITPAQSLSYPLPGAARHLDWDAESSTLVASMALKGVAFLTLDQSGAVTAQSHRPDWLTLSSLSLGEGRHLLADRFLGLRLIETPPQGPPVEVALWPAEGIPTDLLLQDGILYVAAGAAGVYSYQWDGSEEAPRLRARYPFVDYSKTLAWHQPGQVLLVADNFETGMQVIDTAELLRPRQLLAYPLGFVDSVAGWNDLVAVGSRHLGVAIVSLDDPALPLLRGEIPLPPTDQHPPAILRSLRIDAQGRLLVCEGDAGARLFQLADNGQPELLATFETNDGGVLDGIFLFPRKIALSTDTGMLLIVDEPAKAMAP